MLPGIFHASRNDTNGEPGLSGWLENGTSPGSAALSLLQSAVLVANYRTGGDLASTWVAKQSRAYRGPATS